MAYEYDYEAQCRRTLALYADMVFPGIDNDHDDEDEDDGWDDRGVKAGTDYPGSM